MKVLVFEHQFIIHECELDYIPIEGDRIWIGKDFYMVDDRIFTLDKKPFVKVYVTKIS